jgi:vacuolar protein-sorting-associated protein 4
MSLGGFYEQSNQHLSLAISADNERNWVQAKIHYLTCLEYLFAAHKAETNDVLKKKLAEKLDMVLRRCELLQEMIKQSQVILTSSAPHASPSFSPISLSNTEEAGRSEEPLPLKSTSSWFVTEKPNVAWNDVIGLEGPKQVIMETFDLPRQFPSLFNGARKPWTAMLLYGPPGTGKTLLVKALATKLQAASFFSVKSSDIVSKYHGESEKNIQQLFREARQQATNENPVIIFIDELDSLCADRQGGASGGDSAQAANDRIVTEFLQQLDGFASKNTYIFIVGATNIPWKLDSAVLRRFPKRLYIPLPNTLDRQRILQLNLNQNVHELEEGDFIALAKQSEGYGGSDLHSTILDALMCPLREFMNAKEFYRHPRTQKWIPIGQNLDEIHSKFGLSVEKKKMQWQQLDDVDIDQATMPVTRAHLEQSLRQRKPVTTRQHLQSYQEWSQAHEGIIQPETEKENSED